MLIDEYVLGELRRVVVEEVAEGVYCLGDSSREEGVLLRKLVRQSNERLECSCLYARASATWLLSYGSGERLTLNEGMESCARLDGSTDLELPVSLEVNSW